MGKQILQDITLQTLRPKLTNWKMPAKLKYFKVKKYTSNGKECNLLTGIIEAENKQNKINIWSKECLQDKELIRNQDYQFEKGKLDEIGVINFGNYSKIKKSVQYQQISPLIYKIADLNDLGQIQKIIDFQALLISIDEPKPWITKDNKSGLKQILVCGDPLKKICINVTMWDSFLSKDYEHKIYKFIGFKLKTYQNSKQLNSTIFSQIIPIQNPNEIINEDLFNSNDWSNLSDIYKYRTVDQINYEVSSMKLENTLFTITEIKFSKFIAEKCFYQACVFCNKKIENLFDEKICGKCGRVIDTCDIKYILTFRAQGETGSLRVTLFDKISQILFNMISPNLDMYEIRKMEKEELVHLFSKINNKKFKVKLISTVSANNGSLQQSHKIQEFFI